MLAVIGTVPDKNFPLTHGIPYLDKDCIKIDNYTIPINRGTPALLAVMLKASEFITDTPSIYTFLVGDIGLGHGSRILYQFLTDNLCDFDFKAITFHYLQPDVDWHNKVLFTIQKMPKKPLIIADAGFMYAAKMSGQAPFYDMFTPDIGELAFLADEKAPHPFYTRGFILHENNNVENLIKRAYDHDNAAKYLMVKGKCDYIANSDTIIAKVDKPSCQAMEAIGGTGDTITGLITILSGTGIKLDKAAILASKINRLMGYYSNPTPASQIIDLIQKIPQALSDILK